jgi:putative tryptophan/tyrosine transport system substrate-binding protein
MTPRNSRRSPLRVVSPVYAGSAGMPSKAVQLVQRAADDFVRIFQGAQPAELPFVRRTRFESIINLRTARSLGLTLPPSSLLSVDEVIE